MRLFDSHAHLDIDRGTPRETAAVLERAWQAGLEGIVVVAGATRVGEYAPTLALAAADPRLWVAAGIHPHAASGATPDALDKLRAVLDEPRIAALGETGLDYHYNHSPPADQRRAFSAQIRLALDAAKPIVVHTREADHDTLAILEDEGAAAAGGVIHCFSSSMALAQGALGLSFFLSFSGMLTFPNADPIREVAAFAPEQRILAETDAPFLSPVPHRGKVNEPARVAHVVEALAKIRGVTAERMGEITADNARRCYRIAI
ncbi:MAG: TatD family hydrolase [Deltaproteobacteria bacterium]|nr:TatD family hydrolase [Deltaproteobacteria bacterium]